MNKRVKIVATLGPAVEIRGGKKFGEDGYWGEKLDVEASAKNIAKLIEAFWSVRYRAGIRQRRQRYAAGRNGDILERGS